MKKSRESLRDLGDTVQGTNMQIMGISENKREEEGTEIMVENFPNIRKEMDIQIQKAPRILTRLNSKRPHRDIL